MRLLDEVRPLKNAQFCSRSRKIKILTTGIYLIFRGLKFESDAEIGQKGAFCKGLEVGMMLRNIPLESTPPESGRLIYHKVSEITRNLDPYRKIKSKSTKKALSLYPSLKSQIEKSNDRLITAIRIAIAGNVIDFGANYNFDIEDEIDEILEKGFAICDYNKKCRKYPLLKNIRSNTKTGS